MMAKSKILSTNTEILNNFNILSSNVSNCFGFNKFEINNCLGFRNWDLEYPCCLLPATYCLKIRRILYAVA